MRLTSGLGAAAISLVFPAAALAQSAPPAAPGQVNPPASTAPASTSPGIAPAPPPGSPSNMPPASAPSPSAALPASAARSASSAGVNTSATITAGLPVKDKTGASIGSVASVKSDANGKQTATIKMGADTFAVDTAALALDNGSATINATQAEIRAMMKKGGK